MTQRFSIETAPYFYDQREAFALLRSRRWRDGLYCPRCGSRNVREVRTIRIIEAFSCNDCRYNFTTTADTYFHSGRTPIYMRLQLVAAFEFVDVSSPNPPFARLIGMNQLTVQRHMQMLDQMPRIRFTVCDGDYLPFDNFPSVISFLEQPRIVFLHDAFEQRVDQLLASGGRSLRRPGISGRSQ